MMSKELYGSKILNNEDYTIVSLPLKKYEDTSLEFVAILPLKEDIHSFVTSDDFNAKLEKALSSMENLPTDKDYYVYLPRFKYNRGTSLEKDLQKLGVTDAFLPVADFSKIAETKLVVDKVLHKADIELSERGIKAAAATVITLRDNAMIEQRERVNLTFDKPFMYIIRDTKTNELWFVGTVYEPLKWENVKDDYK
jgi:serpin B